VINKGLGKGKGQARSKGQGSSVIGEAQKRERKAMGKGHETSGKVQRPRGKDRGPRAKSQEPGEMKNGRWTWCNGLSSSINEKSLEQKGNGKGIRVNGHGTRA